MLLDTFPKTQAALKNTILPDSKFTEVPNNRLNATLNADLISYLRKLAAAFEIDFDATGYTFLLCPDKGGKTVGYVMEPTVQMSEDGKLCVFWGNVVKPLETISNYEIGKAFQIRESAPGVLTVVNQLASDADEDAVAYYELTLRTIAKSNDQPENINAMTFKRLAKSNNLHRIVQVKKTLPKKLADVVQTGAVYSVIGYGSYETNYNGKADIKYFVFIEGVQGRVQAQGNMVNVLKAEPVISPEKPATLYIGEIKEKSNANGKYKQVSNSLSVTSAEGDYFTLEDMAG